MKLLFLNIKGRTLHDKLRITFVILTYLLIFEGALRKWFLPGFSTPIMLLKEPVILYAFFLGIKYKMIDNIIALIFIILTFISLLLTLTFGHQNFLIAFYGARITILYIPTAYIYAKVLSRKDLLDTGKFLMYISIPMTLLVTYQYLTPQSSIFNIGVGGEGSSGFQGIGEYFRPSGTFSFISGLSAYLFPLAAYVFYYLHSNSSLSSIYKINKWTLIVSLLSLISITFLSISRTAVLQTLLCTIMFLLLLVFKNTQFSKVVRYTIIGIILFLVLLQFYFFRLTVDNTIARFENASLAEGDLVKGTIGKRFLGSYYRAFSEPQNFTGKEIPLFGFGIGYGTKLAQNIFGIVSKEHSFGVAEEEWSRVVCECGLIGKLFLILRTILAFYILYKSCINLKNKFSLAFLIAPCTFLFVINSQWGVGSNGLFTLFLLSISLAAIKKKML